MIFPVTGVAEIVDAVAAVEVAGALVVPLFPVGCEEIGELVEDDLVPAVGRAVVEEAFGGAVGG